MIDYEQSLIASMVINTDCLHDVLEIVSVDHFLTAKHKSIVELVIKKYMAGDEIDPLSIGDETGELDYLTELITETHTVSPLSCATAVFNAWVKRTALQRLQGASEAILEASTNIEVLAAVNGLGDGLEIEDKDEMSWGELVKDSMVRLDQRMTSSAPLGLLTGYTDLDERISGYQDGNMIIVCVPL